MCLSRVRTIFLPAAVTAILRTAAVASSQNTQYSGPTGGGGGSWEEDRPMAEREREREREAALVLVPAAVVAANETVARSWAWWKASG